MDALSYTVYLFATSLILENSVLLHPAYEKFSLTLLFRTQNRIPERKYCPITGMLAKYYDPVTQTPYANLQAFKVIRETMHKQLEKQKKAEEKKSEEKKKDKRSATSSASSSTTTTTTTTTSLTTARTSTTES